MRTRIIAVALIKNQKGEILLLKSPKNLGVYPDQWGLVGGGVDKDETITQALEREVKEEIGIKINHIKPFFFQDDQRQKQYPDGSKEEIYMVYLIFDCQTNDLKLNLNDEWLEYRWVPVEDLKNYQLNPATQKTFVQKGWL